MVSKIHIIYSLKPIYDKTKECEINGSSDNNNNNIVS